MIIAVDRIASTLGHIIPILCHLLGIYLLLVTSFKTYWQRIQKRYLLWLSTVEALINSYYLVYPYIDHYGQKVFHVNVFVTSGFATLMMLTLYAMTIDRALFVYLSVRYDSKTVNRATNVVFVLNVFVSTAVSVILLLTQKTKHQFTVVSTIYFWPIVDILTLLVFVSCYTFITRTVRHRSRILHGVESEVYKRRMKKGTLLPKLIVSSYLICFTIFNILFLSFHTGLVNHLPTGVFVIAYVFWGAGYTTDALFYIFFIPQVRRKLKDKLYTLVVSFLLEETNSNKPATVFSVESHRSDSM